MEQVTPLPSHGSVFFDERDQGRSLRLSYHQDSAVFVISLWRFDLCLGTFRLPAEDAATFVHSLVEPLAEQSGLQSTTERSATA
jgi:hypothetical protein